MRAYGGNRLSPWPPCNARAQQHPAGPATPTTFWKSSNMSVSGWPSRLPSSCRAAQEGRSEQALQSLSSMTRTFSVNMLVHVAEKVEEINFFRSQPKKW